MQKQQDTTQKPRGRRVSFSYLWNLWNQCHAVSLYWAQSMCYTYKQIWLAKPRQYWSLIGPDNISLHKSGSGRGKANSGLVNNWTSPCNIDSEVSHRNRVSVVINFWLKQSDMKTLLMSSEILVNEVVVCISDGGGQSLSPPRAPGGRPAGPQTRPPASGSQARPPDRAGDPGGGRGGAGGGGDDNLWEVQQRTQLNKITC